MRWNGKTLQQLIEEGEHQMQDFKFCVNDSMKIAKSLVAFANTDGGRLLIGVKDNGKIAGVRSDEEFFMIEAAANVFSKPKVEFTTQLWTVESKTVLQIDVLPSEKKPHLAKDENQKWIPYVRVDDENVVMDSVVMKALELSRGKKGVVLNYGRPQETLFRYLNKNERVTLKQFARIANLSLKEAENIMAELLFLESVEIKNDNEKIFYRLKE